MAGSTISHRRRSLTTDSSSSPSSSPSQSPPSPSCSTTNDYIAPVQKTSSTVNRVSRSPPRSNVTSPPRALRVLRLSLYSIAAPNFIYAMYVQLIVLKGPGRSPLPASLNFGRDSLFLTFHGNFHCTWYACLCLLHAFLSLRPNKPKQQPTRKNNKLIVIRRRSSSYAARIVEWASHRFAALIFPLATFIGLAYYLILHFHPLNRLRAQLVPDHDSKMALLHLNPFVFIIMDSWLKDSELLNKHGMKKAKATRAIIAYGIVYFVWTSFCVKLNGGHWPYPFQKSFSIVQHLMFVAGSLLFSAYLCRAGFRLHARLDRRRRKRLATSTSTSDRATTNVGRRLADNPGLTT